MKTCPPKYQAFSIIEQLVVVAVLTLVVALLVPALNKASARANAVKCTANLRVWMNALHLYAPDNGGRLPPSQYTANSSDDATSFLWPYMGVSSKVDAWQKYFCPVKKTSDGTKSQAWGTYGFNSFISEKPLASITEPSRLIYAMDLASSGRWIGYSIIFGGKPQDLTEAYPKPHQRSVNVAYVDGHIEFSPVSQLMRGSFTRYTDYYLPTQDSMPIADAKFDR